MKTPRLCREKTSLPIGTSQMGPSQIITQEQTKDHSTGATEQNSESPKPHLIMRNDTQAERGGYINGPINQVALPCQSKRHLLASRLMDRGLCLPWLWPTLLECIQVKLVLFFATVSALQFFVLAGTNSTGNTVTFHTLPHSRPSIILGDGMV